MRRWVHSACTSFAATTANPAASFLDSIFKEHSRYIPSMSTASASSSEGEWIHVIRRRRMSTAPLTSASLQEWIRTRIRHGISQDHADHMCGFSPHTIKDIESRRICPHPWHLQMIERVFGVVLVTCPDPTPSTH